MDAKLKALWIEALRSGEYKQAVGTLKAEYGGYCCLGLLSHVAARAGMLGTMTEVREAADKMTVLFTDEEGTWENDAELCDGCFGLDDNIIAECMARNDGSAHFETAQQTFAQLADYIEAEVPAEA